jgi:hypothetical protein
MNTDAGKAEDAVRQACADDQTLHHHSMKDHVGYLEEPFHEATELVHRRMHQLGIPH